MNVRKQAFLGVLIAIALVFMMVESFIPSPFIPGMKLGLANIVILITMYELSCKDAFIVDLARVFLAGLLRGTIFQMGFMMSLAGALLSFIVMLILYKGFKNIHIITVSIFGAISHSVAQILVGSLYLGTFNVFIYLPILIIVSIATGIFVGIVSKKIIQNGAIKRVKDMHGF